MLRAAFPCSALASVAPLRWLYFGFHGIPITDTVLASTWPAYLWHG